MRKLKTFDQLKKEMLLDPEVREQYELLQPQYQLESEIIKARIEGKISQKELAKRINTTQAEISRIESQTISPSINTVAKIARAFGKRLEIRFVSQK